jgi:Peptidase propeptide and YPEB domain
MRVFVPLGLILILSACSDAPTETKVKQPEKPPAPVTARQAFQYTYPAARGWADDCQPLRVRSIHLTDVPAEPGKAGAWEIIYVSPAQQQARIYTWSAIEASETLHKDVFAGKPQAWSGSSGQEIPFEAGAFRIDTPEALETAKSSSETYLDKPGTKPAVNYMLEFTPRFPDAVWRVMWGETPGSAQYTVFVDATTGQVVGKG